jgi:ComEC/Rec2-related protein
MPPAPALRIPLAGLALAAVAGILLAEYGSTNSRFLLGISAVGLLLACGRQGQLPLWLATVSIFAVAHDWQWNNNPDRRWAEALSTPPRTVQVTGVLTAEPTEISQTTAGTNWSGEMYAESWTIDGRKMMLPAKIRARWSSRTAPRYGDRWTIEGVVSRPSPPRNPGQFDAASWLARQGIFLELRSRHENAAKLRARDQGSPIKKAALSTREWILRTLGLGLEGDEGIRAVMAGITIGARDDDAETFSDSFRQTGTLHLFAVSGLHVGMFGLLLWLVLRPLGLSRRQAILVIIPMLFFYSLVTGAKPSSLRAATMISIAMGGFLLDRTVAPGNSLAAAALVLLGYDTNQLFQPGFQLSFCVVSSIILLGPPLDQWLGARLRPDPFIPRKLYTPDQRWRAYAGRNAAAALSISAASWLGSLPLTIAFFHLVPVLAIPVNMLAVPLAFAILSVSMLSLTGGLFSSWLAAVFNQTNWALTSLLVGFVQWSAALPGSYFHWPPGWMQPPARLTVFDLGTGSAQLLRTPQSSWLIDTGTEYDLRNIIIPALRQSGVGHLEALVLTHGDTDHLGGAAAAQATLTPGKIIESTLNDRSPSRKNFHAFLRSQNFGKSLVWRGDILRVDQATSLRVLAPSAAGKARLADDQALVLGLYTHGLRVLLMSDAGAATERQLLQQSPDDLRCDVLVLGRHGEDIYATSEFLARTRPQAIILSQADPFRDSNNEAALQARLARTGAAIFDQADCGAVTVTLYGDHAEIRGYLNNQTATVHPR